MSSRFDFFMTCEIALSKSSITMIEILDVFVNEMRLFRKDQDEQMEKFEHGNVVRQIQAMKRMRTGLLCKDFCVSSSTVSVSRHQDLQPTTSNFFADLIPPESFRLRPRTANSASRPLVQ